MTDLNYIIIKTLSAPSHPHLVLYKTQDQMPEFTEMLAMKYGEL